MKIIKKFFVFTSCSFGRDDPFFEYYETAESSIIVLRKMNENEIDEYIKTTHCEESSGALVVEFLIEKNLCQIKGELSTIQGAPLSVLKKLLK
jgi:predicted house-cleaning NTP pyrophosphatase (Maf/HAM1 superfamily)